LKLLSITLEAGEESGRAGEQESRRSRRQVVPQTWNSELWNAMMTCFMVTGDF